MTSIRAWLLNQMFRWMMKRHGDKPIDLVKARAGMVNPPKAVLHIPPGFQVRELTTEGGLRFDVAEQAGHGQQAVVLYLHGGGYFFGSPKTHRQIIVAMAKAFDGPVFGLDYRLAPEHPFPAAVEDAAAAYRYLLAAYPRARIVLAGDSAGGGLALVTAIGARDAGLRRPAAIVGFSPWTDLAVTGASVEANARSCAMFTPKGVRTGAALYLAGADAADPLASPLYADLADLPPMLLFASRQEILLDDTVRFADRARAAGVDVQVELRDGLPHVWPVFVRLLPEAKEALAVVTGFARRLHSGA